MQVLAFLEIKQHFPNVCPCNCFVHTGLNLIDMLNISYALINFSIISKRFHKNRDYFRPVINVNQEKNRP